MFGGERGIYIGDMDNDTDDCLVLKRSSVLRFDSWRRSCSASMGLRWVFCSTKEVSIDILSLVY